MSVGTYALADLATVKQYLGWASDKQDPLLEEVIDRVTALFEAFTNRKLAARDYDPDSDPDNAVLDGNGTDTLALPQYPVNSITTLSVDEFEITERESRWSCGWVLEKKTGIVRLSCYLFTQGLANVEATYNAGFSTVPADLVQAFLEQVAWTWKLAPAGGKLLGQASQTGPDGTVTYVAGALLPTVRAALEHYKKRTAL